MVINVVVALESSFKYFKQVRIWPGLEVSCKIHTPTHKIYDFFKVKTLNFFKGFNLFKVTTECLIRPGRKKEKEGWREVGRGRGRKRGRKQSKLKN